MRERGLFTRRYAVVAIVVGVAWAVLVAPTQRADAEVYVQPAPRAAWGVDGRVFAQAVVGDVIIVGGEFDAARGPSGQSVARHNLAGFDLATGDLLTDWRADTDRAVRVLRADGPQVYVGGAFTRIDGRTLRRVARIDAATGAVDPSFDANVNATVRGLALDDASVYVGGNFTRVDGAVRGHLARLDKADGDLDGGFVANADGPVFSLVRHPSADTLYVGGRFQVISGSSRNGVAAVDSTSGAIRPITFTGAAQRTLGLAINEDGTRLYGGAGGNNAAAAWSTTSGARIWRVVAMGDIQAIAYHSDTVYFGFHEGIAGDTTAKVLAADAGSGDLDPAFRPTITTFMGVFSITTSAAGVAIGGEFTRVSGVPAQHWAWFPAA